MAARKGADPMNRSRRLFSSLALAIAFAASSHAGVLASAQATSADRIAAATPARPYCGIYWGSLPKTHRVSTYTSATIENLRAGRHQCFDRLVVDLGPMRTGLPGAQGNGYQVRYVPEVRFESGDRLQIEGGAVLSIFLNAAAHDNDFRPTYDPRDNAHAVDVAGFRTFRQGALMGTFESQTELAVGVRARLPFRAFVLAGPDDGSRLVIDVAHRW
jgi:hypothetical protein